MEIPAAVTVAGALKLLKAKEGLPPLNTHPARWFRLQTHSFGTGIWVAQSSQLRLPLPRPGRMHRR